MPRANRYFLIKTIANYNSPPETIETNLHYLAILLKLFQSKFISVNQSKPEKTMNYATYFLSALMTLAISTSIEAEDLTSLELGEKYFEANWNFSEGKGRAYQPQPKTTDDVLAEVSVEYFNNNWNLADTACNSCVELVANLDGYKLFLIRDKQDD